MSQKKTELVLTQPIAVEVTMKITVDMPDQASINRIELGAQIWRELKTKTIHELITSYDVK